MVTKTRMSFEDRKSAIIDAALPLFAKLGFNNTTTKEIAQCAGISEALLYQHFSSKNDLYDLIQQQCCEGTQYFAGMLITNEPSGKTLMHAICLVGFSLTYGFDGPEELNLVRRLIMNSLLDNGEFVESFNQNHLEVWFPHIIENLQAAKLEGCIVEGCEIDRDHIWIVHHLFAGLGFFLLPETNIIKYQSDKKNLLRKSLLFSLRGVGFKESFIQENFNFENIYNLFTNDFFPGRD